MYCQTVASPDACRMPEAETGSRKMLFFSDLVIFGVCSLLPLLSAPPLHVLSPVLEAGRPCHTKRLRKNQIAAWPAEDLADFVAQRE